MTPSSMEAKYRAACTATCEALWLRWILEDLNGTREDATVVMCNKCSCIAIVKNLVFHARTKHIEVHYFTKALPREQLERLIWRMVLALHWLIEGGC